jgi:hypothetical protein
VSRPFTNLCGADGNVKPVFATAPGIISDNNITISASVNRKSIFELTLTKETSLKTNSLCAMTFCLYNMLKTQQTGLLLTSMVENLMKVQLLHVLLVISAKAVSQSML